MTQEKIIRQAIKEISLAETLVIEAGKKYYSAKKKLESIYSPASPKRVKKGLSDAQIQLQIAKRNNKIYNNKKRPQL